MHAAFGRIGESDCEVLGVGAFAQPSNTWSSFAYVIVGLLVVIRGLRAPIGERLPQTLFGLAVVAVGVGSVAFHGLQPGWARLVHDLANLAILAFVVAFDLVAIHAWSRTWLLSVFVGLVAVLGVIIAAAPEAALLAAVPMGVAAVTGEVVVYRRRLRGSGMKTRTLQLYGMIASIVAVAGVSNVLGRTGGPLCDPNGLLQLHALWHVLTAAAFGLWVFIGFPGIGVERATAAVG